MKSAAAETGSSIFDGAHNGEEGRRRVPPVFLFAKTGEWRDVIFLGLAVPGASDLTSAEDLVAIWRTAQGRRFQNYHARFTVLDAAEISREWINSIIASTPDNYYAPPAWLRWQEATGASRYSRRGQSNIAVGWSNYLRTLKAT